MDDNTYVELIDTIRFYIIDKTIPVETAEQVFDASTDDLLGWLPIKENMRWVLVIDSQNIFPFQADLYQYGSKIYFSWGGDTLPEAILRCWLAYKAQETT